MIELALHHARQGYPVFPLTPGTKDPIRGSHSFKDATLDVNQIESWWNVTPQANVGIPTGDRTGVLAIDIDPRKCDTWLQSLHELRLPPTFTIKTPSGGWHLYFAMSRNPRITIGANLLPGIDWRGNGGYVVAAGSVVNGVTYEIAKNLPIASAPQALLERLLARRRLQRPIKDPAGHMVIPDGARNETLFALACLLRRFGLEFNTIYESLRAANADHCDPAVDDAELRQIAASALRYTPRESA